MSLNKVRRFGDFPESVNVGRLERLRKEAFSGF